MHKIGLTGGICTGKTYVLNIFEKLGCYTIKADDIAKRIIFSKKSNVYNILKEKFGDEIFVENEISKEKLSSVIFSNQEKRDFVNNLVHPLVAEEREKLYEDIKETEQFPFFIYESSLLIEAQTYKDFEKIIVVYTNFDEQVKRLVERDKISEEIAIRKIKAQIPIREKLKFADYTIDTTGDFEMTKNKTLEIFSLMKKNFNIE